MSIYMYTVHVNMFLIRNITMTSTFNMHYNQLLYSCLPLHVEDVNYSAIIIWYEIGKQGSPIPCRGCLSSHCLIEANLSKSLIQ